MLLLLLLTLALLALLHQRPTPAVVYPRASGAFVEWPADPAPQWCCAEATCTECVRDERRRERTSPYVARHRKP